MLSTELMRRKAPLFDNTESGAAMIEYALLVACFLLSLSAVVSLEEGATAAFYKVDREMTCTGVSSNGVPACRVSRENEKS